MARIPPKAPKGKIPPAKFKPVKPSDELKKKIKVLEEELEKAKHRGVETEIRAWEERVAQEKKSLEFVQD